MTKRDEIQYDHKISDQRCYQKKLSSLSGDKGLGYKWRLHEAEQAKERGPVMR